ncbi:MAG: DMT family transporter [Phototrophicaceae bacterium]
MNSIVQTGVVIGVAIVAGLVLGFQAPMNAVISGRVGLFAGSLIVHIGGLLASLLILLLLRGENISQWQSIPRWYFISGALGVIVVVGFAYSFPQIGAANTVTLVVAGQLIGALLIDQFGWFGATVKAIEPLRIGGTVLLLMGAYLMSR